MTNSKKYSIITAAIAYITALIIAVAVFIPPNVGNIYKESGSAKYELTVKDVKKVVHCTLGDDGSYAILEPDPQIIFDLKGGQIECVKLNLADSCANDVPFDIFISSDGEKFSSNTAFSGTVFAGQTETVIDVPKGDYSLLRVDIDSIEARFGNIEIYDRQPDLIPYKPDYPALNYILTVIIPVIIAVLVWLVQKKTRFVEIAVSCIKRNKFKILEGVVFSTVAILAAVLIELIISITAAKGLFNVYRCIFIAGILELAVVFALEYKNLRQKPEKVFLPVVLILGLVMLFASPIKHICWDLDSHYKWAIQNSFFGTAYETVADRELEYAGARSLINEDMTSESYRADLRYFEQSDKILAGKTDVEFSLAHLPTGIVIAVARLLGLGFAAKYNLGRLMYLLIYSFVCYFAIKRIKSGKMIISVICLFPTNLFLATNFAYDWWVTAFTVLGTAYFVNELQHPNKPVSVKDTVIMGLAFALGAIPKLVYIVLMGMTLFMRKNWQSKAAKKRYYFTLVSIFAVVFVMFVIKSLTTIGGEGDLRGGNVNPTEQLAGIISAPAEYAKLLFKFLTDYLSVKKMSSYISDFAYLGKGVLWIIPACLIVITALTDTDRSLNFKIPLYMKILSVVLFVGMAALIASALYIAFTPVGYDTVNGCQPRYIIPLLAPILLLVGGKRFDLIKNKSLYNGFVLVASSVTVLVQTYTHIITKMI